MRRKDLSLPAACRCRGPGSVGLGLFALLALKEGVDSTSAIAQEDVSTQAIYGLDAGDGSRNAGNDVPDGWRSRCPGSLGSLLSLSCRIDLDVEHATEEELVERARSSARFLPEEIGMTIRDRHLCGEAVTNWCESVFAAAGLSDERGLFDAQRLAIVGAEIMFGCGEVRPDIIEMLERIIEQNHFGNGVHAAIALCRVDPTGGRVADEIARALSTAAANEAEARMVARALGFCDLGPGVDSVFEQVLAFGETGLEIEVLNAIERRGDRRLLDYVVPLLDSENIATRRLTRRLINRMGGALSLPMDPEDLVCEPPDDFVPPSTGGPGR